MDFYKLLPMTTTIFFPIFLLYFFSISSSAYTVPTKYFINCGSTSSLSLDGRDFVGDSDSGDSPLSVGRSRAVHIQNPSSDTIYSTARVCDEPSSYDLDIQESGTYFVRFHFFPFASGSTNLSDAVFDVSGNKFQLLSSFSVVSNGETELPVIKEFLMYITASKGKFRIYFKPAVKSFAFVNAMEVFLLPDNFTLDFADAVPPVKSQGDDRFHGVHSNALQTLYRVNVGGSAVNESTELWRKWVRDDGYVVSNSSAKKPCTGNKLGGGPNGVEDIAPESVYLTCRQVDDSESSNLTNLTWSFRVKKNTRHFVRLHFCDLLSISSSILPKFNLYIYRDYNFTINPFEYGIKDTAVPYFNDWVVDSDASGYINISISPMEDNSDTQKVAYLNGLEIMEFTKNSSFELPPAKSHSNNQTLIVVIASVGSVVVLVSILMLLFFLVSRRRKSKAVKNLVSKAEPPYGKGKTHSWISEKTENAFPVPNLNLKLKMPFAEILAATQSFSTKLLIGEGGFGKVYKGTLLDGRVVAVKRSDSSHGQGFSEFQTEVTILSKIRHRHLVSLIGYCDERNEMILVYEFMEKGTLRDHLYDWKGNSNTSFTKSELTWKQRLEICIGSAKGLHYLHTGSDGGIIHRDVKSTNILLDESYVAKVADFGLSQSGPPDQDHYSEAVKGSFGYLDPEYFRTLQLTDKSDVHSFGVVLLEVLCARPPIVNSTRREEINLAEWGMFWQNKGQLEKIIDPLLVGKINPNSLRKFGDIAEKCLKPEGAERPTMLDVCWDLEYALQLEKTAVHREPFEDSTTDASSNMMLPAVQHLNSNIFPAQGRSFDEDDDDTDFSATGVFSQTNIDGAR